MADVSGLFTPEREIWHEDLDFFVRVWIYRHHVTFHVYNVLGLDGDKHAPVFQREGSDHGPDPVDSVPGAERFLYGDVKWDRCSNWRFDDDARDIMIHACDRDGLERIGQVLLRCYDLTAEILPTWLKETA